MASDWNVSADPKTPAAASEFFRAKTPMLSAEFYKLRYQARQRAFTVSSATRLDQVTDVMRGIERAIKNGESFGKFKRGLSDKLTQAYGKRGFALEAIFRNNVQGAYQAGRYRGSMRPENLAARPIGRFNALEDGRLCPICADCDGVTLPLDDAWWQSHNPLMHSLCRCEVDTLRPDEADKMTPFEELPGDVAADGFGEPATLEEFEPRLDNKDPDAVAIFQQKLEDLPAAVLTPLPEFEVSKPVLEQLPLLENEIVDHKTESAYAWRADGHLALLKEGGKKDVTFTGDEVEKLRDTIFTHNHPGGGSLSADDVKLAVQANLRTIRAVGRGPDGVVRVYTLTRGPGGWPPENFVTNALRLAYKKTMAESKEAVAAGTVTREEAEARFSDEAMKKVVAEIATISQYSVAANGPDYTMTYRVEEK